MTPIRLAGPSATKTCLPSLVNSMPTGCSSAERTPGTVKPIFFFNDQAFVSITATVPGVRSELLQPVGIEFTKDGKHVFVALGPANRIGAVSYTHLTLPTKRIV